MPRGSFVTEAERRKIIKLLGDGIGAAEIGRQVKRSTDTVCRIAASIGHTFGKTNEERAEARRAYCHEARRRIQLKLLAKAEKWIDELEDEVTVWSFGGRDNTFNSKVLKKPDPKTVRERMTAIAIAVDKAEAIEKNSSGGGEDTQGAILAFFKRMGIVDPPAEAEVDT